MLIEPNSKYSVDSSQLEEFLYQIEQTRYHLKDVALNLKAAITSLKLSERSASYMKEALSNLVKGGTDGRAN